MVSPLQQSKRARPSSGYSDHVVRLFVCEEIRALIEVIWASEGMTEIGRTAIIYFIIFIYLFTAIRLLPGGSGYFYM